MRLFLLPFLIGFSKLLLAQSVVDSALVDHYKTDGFDCAIFSAKTMCVQCNNQRFTPTRLDIENAERLLLSQLRVLNKHRANQVTSPIIDQNLRNYVRQYFGYIESNGRKILFVNFLWKDADFKDHWLEEEVDVSDGGSYYWNVKFDLKREKFSELSVNGYG